jgi:hypothetical protein
VNLEQSTRIAVALGREAARSASLCGACVELLDVAGAGITIMGGKQTGPVCVSNNRMAALEDLQFASGEGPCQDAYRLRSPVHAPRLDESAVMRWSSFVDLANATGIGAVFAFPMSNRGAKVGVLTLYQDHEGELSVAQNDDSLALVEVLTETVLSLQDAAPPGTLAADLEHAGYISRSDLSGIRDGCGSAVHSSVRRSRPHSGVRIWPRPNCERRCR